MWSQNIFTFTRGNKGFISAKSQLMIVGKGQILVSVSVFTVARGCGGSLLYVGPIFYMFILCILPPYNTPPYILQQMAVSLPILAS